MLTPETGAIKVLVLGAAITRRPKLFEAAVRRIAEIQESGAAAIVFSTSPLIMAGALLKQGFSAVAMSSAKVDPSLLSTITSIGAIPVIEGGQYDAMQLGAALGSSKVIVYTKSQGLMSADPERVEGAVSVRYASHVELMELAEHRAAPITKDAARAASRHGVPYEIRDVTGGNGTIVRPDGYEGRFSPITSITVSSGYAFVAMRPLPETKIKWNHLQMGVLEKLAAAGISLEMLQSSQQSLRFLVPSNRLDAVKLIAGENGLEARTADKCAKLCIVGTGVRSVAGVFYRSLTALIKNNIPVLHWSDSNVTLSFVVNENFGRAAERTLHETLAPGSEIAVGSPIGFDVDLGIVRVNGQEKKLGSRQSQLLRHLVDNIGRIVGAEELASELFGADGKDELAAVRVHLHNLRKKIEDDPYNPRYIVTVPNQGYVFVR
jgi:hypothetical protein